MIVDYAPEDVVLDATALPLCDTMGHAEGECAAALLVLALSTRGHGWVPVPWNDLVWAVECGQRHWLRNPFFRPDFAELVDKGYAFRPLDSGTWLELTPKAIERIRK